MADLERGLDALMLPRNPEARLRRIEAIIVERNRLREALAAMVQLYIEDECPESLDWEPLATAIRLSER